MPSGEVCVRLQIWDVAGQDRFEHLTRLTFQGASAVIIVCDLSRSKAIEKVRGWKEEVERKLGEVECLVVGNKIDLLSGSEGFLASTSLRTVCDSCGIKTVKISSAKEGEGVEDAFNYIIRKVYNEKNFMKVKKKNLDLRETRRVYKQEKDVTKLREEGWCTIS
ncbi:hypothetical protein TrVE_jg7919 [Triparma verrucosa]|uniref:Uncharacterized protein n=1 Tax=Triparma verrucosa TaxID=1606542 RepID=A0A9W7C3F3_9STRA|nr:hypothetical protein TrVE_jg7919 [Triparma verrucosa]